MQFRSMSAQKKDEKFDALVVGVFQDQKTVTIDGNAEATEFCNEFLQKPDFKGKPNEIVLLYAANLKNIGRVVLVGLGEEDQYTLDQLRQAAGTVAKELRRVSAVATCVATSTFLAKGLNTEEAVQAFSEGVILATYEYRRFKTTEAEEGPAHFDVAYAVADDKAEITARVKAGKIIAEAVNFARDLQNHPGNWLTPSRMAELASAMAAETGLQCRVLERKDMQELKMGALLGVAQGSDEPPKLIVLEHRPDESALDTIVLVGKGITFDSGGISIKPSERMEEMKFDMSGAAAVIGAMRALAQLDPPLHVVGLIPASENLPSGKAMKPGDILTTSSGKTIEIVNTDAEGRLILADSLAYAKRFNPRAVVDLATLTGACVVALGNHASGLIGNDQPLMDRLLAAGKKTGERLWQLPLWKEYHDDIKSDYADLKNSGGRAGGAITAAALLAAFAEDYPWAHLDIAGTGWTDKASAYTPKGGTGVGVRLLVRFLQDWTGLNAK